MNNDLFREMLLGPNYNFYEAAEVPSVGAFTGYCSSSASDTEKAAQLLFNLIILDKRRQYPTAKEMMKLFLQSNISIEARQDVARFIISGRYMNSAFMRELGNERIRQQRDLSSPFILAVLNRLDSLSAGAGMIFANFNFVAREAVFWLIGASADKKSAINQLLKDKVDWHDITVQNGILDYCFENHKTVGTDFAVATFDKAIKANMFEVRLTALRYAYALTKDEKYKS